MRAVKIAVVVMGGLIILGFVVIVAELIRRGLSGPEVPQPALVTLPPDQLGLSEGDRVTGLAAVDGAVVLLIEGPQGGQRIVLVDPERLAADGSTQQ